MKQILAIFAACLLSTTLFPSSSFGAVNQNKVRFRSSKKAKQVVRWRKLVNSGVVNLIRFVEIGSLEYSKGKGFTKFAKARAKTIRRTLRVLLFRSQLLRQLLKCKKKKPECTRKRRQVFNLMKKFIADIKTTKKGHQQLIKKLKNQSKVLSSISLLKKRAKNLSSSFRGISPHLMVEL